MGLLFRGDEREDFVAMIEEIAERVEDLSLGDTERLGDLEDRFAAPVQRNDVANGDCAKAKGKREKAKWRRGAGLRNSALAPRERRDRHTGFYDPSARGFRMSPSRRKHRVSNWEFDVLRDGGD
jgi:hypothetical protein